MYFGILPIFLSLMFSSRNLTFEFLSMFCFFLFQCSFYLELGTLLFVVISG